MKHNQSSIRKEEILIKKCWKTKIRLSNLYFAKIKVSWFITEGKVWIERYQDSLDMHTLEESERLKCLQVIRNLVKQKFIKNYSPSAIVSAVKEFTTEKLDLNSSIKELKHRKVTNIKNKVREIQNIQFEGKANLKLDIEETIFFLKNKEYFVELYQILYQFTRGFVFIYPNQIEKL